MKSHLKQIIVVATLASLPGCLFTTGDGDLRRITSVPSGALVKIEGYGECETPCSIKLGQRREVLVAKAGFKAQRFGILPGKKDVHVILELAAPTSDVDTQALPEL